MWRAFRSVELAPYRHIDLLAWALTLLVIAAPDHVVAQNTLAWKFTPGENLGYRTTETSTVKDDAGREEFAPTLDAVVTWTVKKVDEKGIAEVELKLERIHMEATEKDPERWHMIYDSEQRKTVNNQWSGLMEMIYRPLLGAPYVLSLDRHGDLLAVKLPQDALKAFQGVHSTVSDFTFKDPASDQPARPSVTSFKHESSFTLLPAAAAR
jgi:hypothetical protein